MITNTKYTCKVVQSKWKEQESKRVAEGSEKEQIRHPVAPGTKTHGIFKVLISKHERMSTGPVVFIKRERKRGEKTRRDFKQ